LQKRSGIIFPFFTAKVFVRIENNFEMIRRLNSFSLKIGVVITLVVVMSFALVSWIEVAEIAPSFKKKINKEIVQLWGADGVIVSISLNETQKLPFSKFGVQGVFEIQLPNSQKGFLVLAKARSKFENFDYAVYYDQNMVIKAVRVLQYREDYGGEIGSKRWLRQFDGKTAESPITVDNDIQGISGATISYLAITKGVKSITQLMSEL
jgi:hypothetical protein